MDIFVDPVNSTSHIITYFLNAYVYCYNFKYIYTKHFNITNQVLKLTKFSTNDSILMK